MKRAWLVLSSMSAVGWVLLMIASCSRSVPEGALTHSDQNRVRSVRIYQANGKIYERVVFEDGTECIGTPHGLACRFASERGPE